MFTAITEVRKKAPLAQPWVCQWHTQECVNMLPSTMGTKLISLDAAIVVTGLSKRTLWRRVSDGSISKAGEDNRGRVLLSVEEVVPLMRSHLSSTDRAVLVEADAGDSDAQADIAAVFHSHGCFDVAIYWWRLAADQGHADAMQWLGRCYAAGEGLERNPHLALMWISRAASQGHKIAAAQAAELLRHALSPSSIH